MATRKSSKHDSSSDLGPQKQHKRQRMVLDYISVPRIQMVLAAKDVIEPPWLKRYDLAYNTVHNVIICTICQQGLPFARVFTHISNGPQVIDQWSTKDSRWISSKKNIPGHYYKNITQDNFESELKKLLKDYGSIRFLEDTLEERKKWREYRPKRVENKFTPITGLRVYYPAYSCNHCDYAALQPSSIAKHGQCFHNNITVNERFSKSHVQTLCNQHGICCYFAVNTTEKDQHEASLNSNLTQLTSIEIIHQMKTSILGNKPLFEGQDSKNHSNMFKRLWCCQFFAQV